MTSDLRAVRRLVHDYAYWAETCYRIRDKRGRIIPLRLNPVQRAIGEAEQAMLAREGRARIYVLKGRQGGVSTDQQARNLHQVWGEPHFDAMTLAHAREDTDKLFEITSRALEHFPDGLLPATGGKETREVSFPGLDTHFWTGTAGAKRTGRGLTLKRVHGSEFAFGDAPKATLGTITPALVPEGSVITLETTASGFDSAGHVFWKEASENGNGYLPLFFPWWDCDPVHYRLPLLDPDELGKLEPDEADLVERHGLSLEQIKWRRREIKSLGKTTFLQEYAEDAETCWVAAGGLFYEVETLRWLLDRAPKPIETHLGGDLEIYDHANGERVIIGADTAEGGGGDRSTFTARAFPSWRLLARYASRTVEPKEFAGIVSTWGRFFGGAFQVIEKNAHGITVLRHMRDDHQYPLSLIYHRVAMDRRRDESSERIGWTTTKESHPLLLDAGRELLTAARDGLASPPSADAIRDALAVRRDDKGKVELTGKDVLVSEMLAWIGRTAPVPATPSVRLLG
jgi:hypothetical protein